MKSTKKVPEKKPRRASYPANDKGTPERIREQTEIYLSSLPARTRRKKKPAPDVVGNVENARSVVYAWLDSIKLRHSIELGLPEIDDRKNVWRVALEYPGSNGGNGLIGEVLIDASSGKICHHTDIDIIKSRSEKLAIELDENGIEPGNMGRTRKQSAPPFVQNKIVLGDATQVISELPLNSVQAGWATGRGRRFASDRNPLQYKTVPVTEYVLVYRKQTDKLIDWNIRTHHDPELVKRSKIENSYDVTNVWHITPAHHKEHPAVFPDELVERIIRYYSFVGDLVLDPFAGSGTVGRIALKTERRFFLIDNEPKYFQIMRREVGLVAKTLSQEVLFEPVCRARHRPAAWRQDRTDPPSFSDDRNL